MASTHILSIGEARDCLDLDEDSNVAGLEEILSSVDDYILNATGKAWQSDSEINPTAKSAARLLLKSEYTGVYDAMTQQRITARIIQLRNLVK